MSTKIFKTGDRVRIIVDYLPPRITTGTVVLSKPSSSYHDRSIYIVSWDGLETGSSPDSSYLVKEAGLTGRFRANSCLNVFEHEIALIPHKELPPGGDWE